MDRSKTGIGGMGWAWRRKFSDGIIREPEQDVVLKAAKELEQGGEPCIARLVGGLSPAGREALKKYMENSQGQERTVDGGVCVTEKCFQKMDLDDDGVISKWEFEKFLREKDKAKDDPPTRKQLIAVASGSGVPFVGFGIMDNAIMIIAGEAIEIKLGLVLGMTTMASAAVGNLISDVAGVGMGSYIEAIARRMGFNEPNMTPDQMDMTQTRLASSIGAAIGVAIGCFIGMFPLLFIQAGENDADHISHLVSKARMQNRSSFEEHGQNQSH